MNPDPAIFVIDLQEANKAPIFNTLFCLLLLEGTFTLFFKDESQNSSIQDLLFLHFKNPYPDPDPYL
jgi:hypothetical protein